MSTVALSVTQRVIALAATLAVLVISFVSSFGVYFSQQREIAQTKAEIASHQTQITRLQDEIERWNDPSYVKAQARDQLGWVLPGEVGYRVVDENGDVVGGVDVTTPPAPDSTDQAWYETLWGSVRNADQPVVVAESAAQKPVDDKVINSDDPTGQ
jgi:cell division protein FtsB